MSREDFRTPGHETTDQLEFWQLVREAREGNAEAIGKLFDQCRPYLLAIANSELDDKIAGKVGASDIVQNSIVSAQRCLDQFSGSTREELLAWLRGFLINDLKETHRYYRTEKRDVACEQPLRADSVLSQESRLKGDIESPSTAASERELEERLYAALQTLTDDERLVIELRNWQRMTFSEIGERMSRTPDATRKFWSRAIVRLQRQMEGGDEK